MLAPADPDLVPFDPPEHPSWRATFRNVIETYPRALYGERGCVRYRSGPWDTVFVTDPELIHDVLVARVDSFRRDDIAGRLPRRRLPNAHYRVREYLPHRARGRAPDEGGR